MYIVQQYNALAEYSSKEEYSSRRILLLCTWTRWEDSSVVRGCLRTPPWCVDALGGLLCGAWMRWGDSSAMHGHTGEDSIIAI